MDEETGRASAAAKIVWVERVAAYFARQSDLPLVTGRTIGWLLVCEPTVQSAAQIAAAVSASRASLTTTLRLLTASEFVDVVTQPGDRTTYYRIRDDAWPRMVQRTLAALGAFAEITTEGMRLVDATGPGGQRMRGAHEFYTWLQAELESLPRRWAVR